MKRPPSSLSLSVSFFLPFITWFPLHLRCLLFLLHLLLLPFPISSVYYRITSLPSTAPRAS
ncbi:hypothetical protein FB451DRAFT_1262090 [Mycena latifolia]|nr:hypothetical protein FB451DRAFT_1262090 [Mycena latifolia]